MPVRAIVRVIGHRYAPWMMKDFASHHRLKKVDGLYSCMHLCPCMCVCVGWGKLYLHNVQTVSQEVCKFCLLCSNSLSLIPQFNLFSVSKMVSVVCTDSITYPTRMFSTQFPVSISLSETTFRNDEISVIHLVCRWFLNDIPGTRPLRGHSAAAEVGRSELHGAT